MPDILPADHTEPGLYLGPFTFNAAEKVLWRMRDSDRREVEAIASAEPAVLAVQFWQAIQSGTMLVHYIGRDMPLRDPIVLFGIRQTGFATAEAILLATDTFPAIAHPFARFVRRRIIPTLLALGMPRRVEARCADAPDTIRFLKLMGARVECRCPDMGRDGETYVQVAWTRTDLLAKEKGHVPWRGIAEAAGGSADSSPAH